MFNSLIFYTYIIYYIKHSLNPKTGQPISVNSTFESIFGPIYKFKEWEFANAATGDDISPEDPGTKNIDIDESHPNNINREKFREAIDTVRSSLSSSSEDPITSSDDNGDNNKKKESSTKIRNVEMLTLGTNDAGLPVRKYFDWTIGSVNMQQPINCDDNDDTSSLITSAVILYGDMVNEEESSDR